MTTEELEEQINETFEHLEQGRYRMALTSAKRVYEDFPEDYKSAICLAWALVENGSAVEALELANLAVNLSPDKVAARTYRGYLLTRMSIYDGALSDLDFAINNNTPLPEFACKSKARALAGINQYVEAVQILQDSINSNPSLKESFQYLASLLKIVLGKDNLLKKRSLYETAEEAFRYKEYWFSLWAAEKILNTSSQKNIYKQAHLIKLDSLFHMFRIKDALLSAESLKDTYKSDSEFGHLYRKILSRTEENITISIEDVVFKGRTDFQVYTRQIYRVYSAKTYNFIDNLNSGKRVYLLHFNEEIIRYVGVEIVISNPFYQKRTIDIDGMAVWYLNNNEVGRNRFILGLEKDWNSVEFVQNWGMNSPGFWTKGQGQVDIYLEDKKICTRYFIIGNNQVVNFEKDQFASSDKSTEEKSVPQPGDLNLPHQDDKHENVKNAYSENVKSSAVEIDSSYYQSGIDEELLEHSLEELNKLTGLENVKKEINEIVKLAKFYIEQGDKPENKFTSHFVFLGNPGTGKTTVARLFSRIYCALGILPKGHLVETDRQGLVGVFVGQTAQKTKEMIDKAAGGTLFIDEAYTLSRGSSNTSNDFGGEAIETLLKRMEDYRGKFIVIAAGYTDEMNSFLESNPGLQSRFTRKILFEDFSPGELLRITENSLTEKGYTIRAEAHELFQKYFNKIFRDRDKNFGNARIVRDIVDRVLKNHLLRIADIPFQERTELKLKEISVEDISEVISQPKNKKAPKVQGDSELLDKCLFELSELAGLESVKDSVRKLVSSLKVAKLREEKGLKVIPRNLHSVFAGNPGTGKTTIARLLSKIYKEMGVLEKGHLVEVDRSGLVAGYQGQTAIKTDSVINKALGGTLFIDEAYSLTRSTDDFGQETIDTLIKRMEDYEGKFVVIVAGYTNEMKEFIESNPGMKSRFTNYYTFEDYTPRQLLEIALGITEKNNYKLDEGAWQLMLDICTDLYNKKDKNFGNARMVRNILYKAISNQEERILTLYNPDTEDLSTIILDDVAKISLNEL